MARWRKASIVAVLVAGILAGCAAPAAAPEAVPAAESAAESAAGEQLLPLSPESPLYAESPLARPPVAALPAPTAAPSATAAAAALLLPNALMLAAPISAPGFPILHTEVMRPASQKPPFLLLAGAGDPRVTVRGQRTSSNVGLGDGQTSYTGVVLLEAGSAIEAAWLEPAVTVGVQLWGDHNEGCALIRIDGRPVWIGDTRESSAGNFEGYIEVGGLEAIPHVVTVENPGATGQCARAGHVTVVAFGRGAIGEPHRAMLAFVIKQ